MKCPLCGADVSQNLYWAQWDCPRCKAHYSYEEINEANVTKLVWFVSKERHYSTEAPVCILQSDKKVLWMPGYEWYPFSV